MTVRHSMDDQIQPLHPPSVLIGREQELRTAGSLLARPDVRLLTLRGPGGIGKTALARELARTVQGEYDHVVFVDVTPLRDPQQVLPVISAALPVKVPLPDPMRNVVEFAQETRTLLIVDNFEQVLSAAEQLAVLIEQAPSLQLLVTSRAALHLHDECEYTLDPLALPESWRDAPLSGAVQLFVRRAQAVTPHFELTQENTAQVVRLCEALEGVPLALELAATRLRTFALPDLLARLEHPLQVLKADFRDRPERLRSLRAAVEWSYDLLSEEDREVFACCAVFTGSFTPEALVALWGSDDVLERVEHLIEQSFLQLVEGTSTRWKMLQPLRELVLEHLGDHPQAEAWCERHARYYLSATQGMPCTTNVARKRAQYLPDYPNMRTGLIWALERQQTELALSYLDGIARIWIPFAMHTEGAELTERALMLPAAGHEFVPLRLRGLHVAFECLLPLDRQHELHTRAQEWLALSHASGDELQTLWATAANAIALYQAGRSAEALQLNRQIIEWYEQRGGDREAEPATRVLCTWAFHNAAFDLLDLGEHESALQHAERAVQRFEREGIEWHNGCRTTVGVAQLHLGRTEAAIGTLESSLRYHLDCHLMAGAAAAARALGQAAAQLGCLEDAARFLGFADAAHPGGNRGYVGRWHRNLLHALRQELNAATFLEAWEQGRRLTSEGAAHLAASLRTAVSPVPDTRSPLRQLTAREREVLDLVARGHPDRRIAKELSISPVTASKHVSNMLGKLGLRNRTELARWAAERQVGTSIQ